MKCERGAAGDVSWLVIRFDMKESTSSFGCGLHFAGSINFDEVKSNYSFRVFLSVADTQRR